MERYRFLVLGSGGREHALAWRLSTSEAAEAVFVAPGNPGMTHVATCLPTNTSDFDAIGTLCLQHQIQVVVVGPEQPLVEGIANYFKDHEALAHIHILGPEAAAAQLEGSKAFSKAFMQRHNIPTARYASFNHDELAACLQYLQDHPLPIVVKADGLAAGKGVVICTTLAEAETTVTDMLSGTAFGSAGSTVVIEQYLDGWEMSYFLLCDGTGEFLVLPQARDYKRIGEGNTGPNTGGMGTVSPVEKADTALLQKVYDRIALPSVQGLQADDLPYKGFLFIGLMICAGEPYVIEYNCRMGDPETQSIMSRLGSDFGSAVAAAAQGQLSAWKAQHSLTVSENKACTVVLAAEGYPGTVRKGDVISGLDQVSGAQVFHAGTAADAQGNIMTAGGRVLATTATGTTWQQAVTLAHQAAETITWQGRYFRRDIGRD